MTVIVILFAYRVPDRGTTGPDPWSPVSFTLMGCYTMY